MNPAYPRIAPLVAACLLFTAGCATTSAPAPDGSPVTPTAVMTTRPFEELPEPAIDISKLDRSPVPRVMARPQYPFELRRAGVPGEALVDFVVDPRGNVVNAFAVRATHPQFGVAAVAAVSKWKFQPGVKNDRAVYAHMQVPIVFSLN